MPKIQLRPWQLSLAASTYIAAVSNSKLYAMLTQSLDMTSLSGVGVLVTVFALMIAMLTSLFLCLGVGRFLKPVIAISIVATAVLGFFVNGMGVVFDTEMLRNIADTMRESNAAEALELASWPLLLHVAVFGIVPAVMLAFVELVPRQPLLEARDRLLVITASLALSVGLGLGNYRYLTFFAVEHRDLRYLVTPIYPLSSLVRVARRSVQGEPTFNPIGTDATQLKSARKRTVGVMVVGESARADHFSLGGYDRPTNPLLQQVSDLLYFDISACGTSTAYSVPCMFFLHGHDHYTPEKASAESNVLDVLSVAGVATIWIDNNSGCKHVCDRIENSDVRHLMASMNAGPVGYDEVLIAATDRFVAQNDGDLLIVLHMLGSHGPAYSRRYPTRFAAFQPYCAKQSPRECDVAEVVNAYDNTIVYTDYVVSRLIAHLEQHRDDFDSFLLYASDHGESLGERGIYLHGLPSIVAPRSQVEVPMMIWLSEEYRKDHELKVSGLGAGTTRPLSHDNIPHTLLGLFDIITTEYRQNFDIFGAARPDRRGMPTRT